jgi:hypothetical protein
VPGLNLSPYPKVLLEETSPPFKRKRKKKARKKTSKKLRKRFTVSSSNLLPLKSSVSSLKRFQKLKRLPVKKRRSANSVRLKALSTRSTSTLRSTFSIT